jgi:hypothetical protein
MKNVINFLALSESDQPIIDFWCEWCSNERFVIPFERCLNGIMKYFNCSQG